MDAATVIVLGGGAVIAAKVLGDAPSPTGFTPTAQRIGSSRTMNIIRSKQTGTGTKSQVLSVARGSTYLDGARGQDRPKELLDELTRKAKAEYDALSTDAKRAACRALKQKYPSAPAIQALNCDNPGFQATLGAIAAVGGTAACAATGAGAVISPACGAVAAWVTSWAGPKLEEWAEDIADQAKEWAGDAKDAVGDFVSGLF